MAVALDNKDNREYGVKYYNIITNVGGRTCRSVLYTEVRKANEVNLSSFLNNNRQTIEQYRKGNSNSLKPKLLNNKSFKTLYPGETAASNADEFDITLLMFLFTNVIFPTQKNKLMSSLENIRETDIAVFDDLARIRCYRNKLHEIADTKLSLEEEKLNEYIDKLRAILTRLGTHCDNPPGIERSIREEMNATFKSEETQIMEILKQIKKENKLAKELEAMKEAIQTIAKQYAYKDVKDVLPDAVFVKTKQYGEAKKFLLEERIIILNGSPGEGKTTVAKKLLKEASKVRCIEVNSVKEFNNIGNDVDAVLIDDMFGASVFDKYKYRKWQNKLNVISQWVEQTDCEIERRYVVITSRTYILEKAKDQLLFLKHKICSLSSDSLKPEEKKLIILNHFQIKGKTPPNDSILDKICNLKVDSKDPASPFIIGFPECARIFSISFSGKTFNEDKVMNFFKAPMENVINHISELCKDDDTFVAFFLLWTGKVNSKDIERPLNGTPDTILTPIKNLQYSPKTCLRKIRVVLYHHAHKGGLISEDTSENYTFSHRVVCDAVGLIAFTKNPTAALAHCDKDFIERYISFQSKEDTEKDTKIGIRLKKSRYDQLSSRILDLVIPDRDIIRDNYSLFKCSIFEKEEFCSEFLKADKGKLQILLKSSVRSLEVIFKPFKFNFLENVVKEVKLTSFLLWHKGKVTTFAERCLEEIHDKNEKLKELSTVLYIASAVGLYEVAEFSIKQGGKINSEMILIAFKSRENVQMPKDEEEKEEEEQKEKVLSLFKSTTSESIDCFPDSDRRYPIHLAAMEGYLEFVQKHILEQPEDANIPFTGEVYQPKSKRKFKMNNASLYHIAAFMGNNKLIEELHKARVQAHSVDCEGRTPFLYAIEIGKSKVVKTLLDIAIEMKNEMLPDTNGNTPLHLAIIKSDDQKKPRSKYIFKDVALRLCERRSENIHLENNNGKTPLHLACTYQQNEVIDQLLKNKKTVGEQNLYHKLIKENNDSAIEMLLVNDYIQDVDSENRTPLILAEYCNKQKIVDLFRKYSSTSMKQHSTLQTPKITSETQHLKSASPQPQSNRPRSYSETPQSKSETPQPESKTSNPTSETQQPDSETQQYTPETQPPESKTPHPTPETQPPESETPHPTSETQLPESETTHTTTETQKPESETTNPTSKTQQPESDTPHPTPETQPPESDTPHPTSETQEPVSETPHPTKEIQPPESKTPHPTSETPQPESETSNPTSETQQPNSETQQYTPETQTLELETPQPTSEIQEPESDTPQPNPETPQPNIGDSTTSMRDCTI